MPKKSLRIILSQNISFVGHSGGGVGQSNSWGGQTGPWGGGNCPPQQDQTAPLYAASLHHLQSDFAPELNQIGVSRIQSLSSSSKLFSSI